MDPPAYSSSSTSQAPSDATRAVEKRALLIGIRDVVNSDLHRLDLAHRDARDLHDRLIQSHGYRPENVTLMLDSARLPREVWPTRSNILHHIDRLTHNVPDGCHIFFYFSGHALQEECCGHHTHSMRANGLDSEIVSANGKVILDHILHDRLITPLEKCNNTKLFALFDCCHSESLLDLQLGNEPNRYSRRWCFNRQQLFQALSIAIVAFLKLIKKHSRAYPFGARRQRSIVLGNKITPETYDAGGPSVICLSACRDRQLAHDDCRLKLTFTRCFMDVMRERPGISWYELREKLKEVMTETRSRYENVEWEQEPRISTNSSRMDLRLSVGSQF